MGFSSIIPALPLEARNARRFQRSDVDAWRAAGGPSAYGEGIMAAVWTEILAHKSSARFRR